MQIWMSKYRINFRIFNLYVLLVIKIYLYNFKKKLYNVIFLFENKAMKILLNTLYTIF